MFLKLNSYPVQVYAAINLKSVRIAAISSGGLIFKYVWRNRIRILKNVFMKKLGEQTEQPNTSEQRGFRFSLLNDMNVS